MLKQFRTINEMTFVFERFYMRNRDCFRKVRGNIAEGLFVRRIFIFQRPGIDTVFIVPPKSWGDFAILQICV